MASARGLQHGADARTGTRYQTVMAPMSAEAPTPQRRCPGRCASLRDRVTATLDTSTTTRFEVRRSGLERCG